MNNEELRGKITAQKSTFELLFRTSRRVNEYALATLFEKTGVRFRPSHTAMFPHISAKGVRASEIAKKLGISKQAVSKRVNELVAFGTVERVPDPSDGRAMLVRFNTSSVLEGVHHLNALEEEFVATIGCENMEDLARILEALLCHIDQFDIDHPKDFR